MGYIDANDWLLYSNITFPSSGSYLIEYRVASTSGGTLSSDLNAGTTQLGHVPIPATGGWQTWRTITQTVNVTAGTYSFGIKAQTGGWNLNWLQISKAATTPAAATSAALTTDNPFEATDALEVYPNPVTDWLQLRAAQSLAHAQYQILDALGRLVGQGSAAAGRVNVSVLPPGIYTLKVSAKGKRLLTRRFAK